MKKSVFVAVVLVFLFITMGFGTGNIHFKRISLDEGLSQNAVFCALQDCKGFLWFGTQDGLNKYDGCDFTVYKLDPDNNNSVSHNWISAIYEDEKGIIWIGTRGGGLNSFDPGTERFSRYRVDPDDPDCMDCSLVNAICGGDTGEIWIGTEEGGIYTLTREDDPVSPDSTWKIKKKYRHVPGDPGSLNSNTVNALLKDRSGRIWIGTDRGLDKFDSTGGRFIHHVNIPGDPRSLSHNSVSVIYEDRSGLIWVGTSGGLNLLAKRTGLFSRYRHSDATPNSLSHDGIDSIIEDRSGVLWIGTRGGGLNKFNKRTETFTCYRNIPSDSHSLSYDYISCLFEDASRILWIGTSGKGLNKFDREDKFLHYQFAHNNPNSLNDNYVYSLYEDRSGILWIGTAGGGLNRLDRHTGMFSHFINDPNDPRSLSRNMVRSILEDSSGALWIGTGGGGLDKFNRKTGSFTHFCRSANNPDSLSHNSIYSIFEDSSRVLWIGTTGGGLNRFDRKTGIFSHYRREEDNPNSLSGNYVSVIYESPSNRGVLWIGTRNRGLNRFDVGSGRFTRFEADPEKPGSLSFNLVLSVYEDRAGTLWVGTAYGGLNKLIELNGNSARFAHYTEKDGLPNNSIYGILEDSAGKLWMSTNKGISKFDPLSEEFKNYNRKDGLQGSEFNGGAYHKNKKGEMFFGGINGFNVFLPADIKDNPHEPAIVITGFRISNIPIPIRKDSPLKKSITWTEEIALTFRQKAISFEFAALDFTIPENNLYAYKMEGFDREWKYTGADKRFAYYTNMDPGNYVFRVKGSNNDGVWNEEGTSVKIIILPPFYGTWWFTVLLVVSSVVLLIFFIRLRIKRVEEKSRREKSELRRDMERAQLEKELKLKADFTAMLVHDLRSPLSAVIGFSEILTETPEFVDTQGIGESIKLSSTRMLTLVNEMLDFARFEAGKMALKKKETDILGIMEESIELLNPLFDQKRIKLTYKVPPGMREARLYIDPEKISQVLNNFLSNAIKFAPFKGTVTLGICEVNGDFVELSVTDNGPGIPPDKQKYIFDKYARLANNEQIKGTGLGLAVSQMIIAAHGGTIGYRLAESGKGSMFYFRLPV